MLKPLVPNNCVLTDFAFMPLDVRRLLNSETWVLGNDSERSAAMCLWLESWHQKPAASVPNNAKMLAHLSKAGSKWAKVKDHVLRGWVDGGDGRLYHPVVAEKALEAWIEKLSNAISGNEGNAKRWQVAIDSDELKSDLCDAVERLKALAPQSKTLNKKIVKTIQPPSKPDQEGIAPRLDPESGGDRNRQGQGQGQGQGNNKSQKAFVEIPENQKRPFADFGFDQIPQPWAASIQADWPDLHPDDLMAKWDKYKTNASKYPSLQLTSTEFFEDFKTRWIDKDAPRLIELRKSRSSQPERQEPPVPICPPPKPAAIGLAGMELVVFNQLHKQDPTLTQQVIFNLAAEHGLSTFQILRDMQEAAS